MAFLLPIIILLLFFLVQNEKVVIKSVTPKELLQQYQIELKEKKKKQQQQKELSANNSPVLGKGFYPGSDIVLDCCPKKIPKPANHNAELSKVSVLRDKIALTEIGL